MDNLMNLINELKLCDEAIDVLVGKMRENKLVLDFNINTINIFNTVKKIRRMKIQILNLEKLMNDLNKIRYESKRFLNELQKAVEIKEKIAKSKDYLEAEFGQDGNDLEKYEEQLKDFLENVFPNIDLNNDERI